MPVPYMRDMQRK